MPIDRLRVALGRFFAAIMAFAVIMILLFTGTLGYLVVKADLRNRTIERLIDRRREEHRELQAYIEDLADHEEDLARRIMELNSELAKWREARSPSRSQP